MTDKQKVANELQKYNDRAGVITKSQIARFLGEKKPGARVNRLVENLDAYECRYYLVQDVAEAFAIRRV